MDPHAPTDRVIELRDPIEIGDCRSCFAATIAGIDRPHILANVASGLWDRSLTFRDIAFRTAAPMGMLEYTLQFVLEGSRASITKARNLLTVRSLPLLMPAAQMSLGDGAFAPGVPIDELSTWSVHCSGVCIEQVGVVVAISTAVSEAGASFGAFDGRIARSGSMERPELLFRVERCSAWCPDRDSAEHLASRLNRLSFGVEARPIAPDRVRMRTAG